MIKDQNMSLKREEIDPKNKALEIVSGSLVGLGGYFPSADVEREQP